MVKNKTRNSGLELLRLISIFLIIIHHACINDSLKIFHTDFNPNHVIVSIIGIWGNFGVTLFFMISFWFMLEEKYIFHIGKLINLTMEAILLSLIAFYLSIAIFHDYFSLKQLVKVILSPVLGTYWYLTTYLIIYLLMPFLRIFINNLNNIQLMTLFLFSSLIILYRGVIFSWTIGNLDLAIYIVFLTAVVKRKYVWFKKNVIGGGVLGICIVVTLFTLFINHGQGIFYELFVNRFSVFQILGTAFIFVYFKEKVSFENKLINFLTESVFGIYILHSSPNIANHIWQDTFHIYDKFLAGPYWGIQLIGSSLAVFFICGIVSLAVHKIISSFSIKNKWIGLLDSFLNFEKDSVV